jgi:hypothetical protein
LANSRATVVHWDLEYKNGTNVIIFPASFVAAIGRRERGCFAAYMEYFWGWIVPSFEC